MAAASQAILVWQPHYSTSAWSIRRQPSFISTLPSTTHKARKHFSMEHKKAAELHIYIAINHTQSGNGRHEASCRGNELSMPVVKQAAVRWAATFLVSTAVLSSMPFGADIADASDMLKAQGVFQRSCVGCHVGGGNILQPGATLTAPDLQRNGLSTVEDIFKITYSGKGRMPGFGELCAPRGQCTFGPRLSDEDIRSLAEFVRLQADQGWKSSQ